MYPCPVQSPSTLSYLLSLLCSIGMATLAQPHSYSLPILVIGLTHEAPARSPPTVDMFGHFCGFSLSAPLSLLHTHTHTHCTHANGARVHEEETGFNLQSSLVVLSSSSALVGQQRGTYTFVISHCVQVFCGKCVWLRSLSYLLITIVLTD